MLNNDHFPSNPNESKSKIILRFFFFWFVSQTDVSDGTRDVRRQRPGRGRRRLLPVGVESALLRSAGRGAGGRQALPLRLPPVVVAGGRQGRPAGAGAPLHAPGLAVHRRPAAQADHLLREGQTDQQRNGQTGTGRASTCMSLKGERARRCINRRV